MLFTEPPLLFDEHFVPSTDINVYKYFIYTYLNQAKQRFNIQNSAYYLNGKIDAFTSVIYNIYTLINIMNNNNNLKNELVRYWNSFEMADEVYRLIPYIRSMVDHELMIHKYTNHSTEYWLNSFVRKGMVVRMIFTETNKCPSIVISPSWSYCPYERKHNEPNKIYTKLCENGEWVNYVPLTQISWEDRAFS